MHCLLSSLSFWLRKKIIDNMLGLNKNFTTLWPECQLSSSSAGMSHLLIFSYHPSYVLEWPLATFFTQLLWICHPPYFLLCALWCAVSNDSLTMLAPMFQNLTVLYHLNQVPFDYDEHLASYNARSSLLLFLHTDGDVNNEIRAPRHDIEPPFYSTYYTIPSTINSSAPTHETC